MTTSPELDLAFDFVSTTGRHLFLTGKAGTGKTTFLHRIRRDISKRMAVVAPTGVAAINAKGVTIHSQFQLPFGILTPDRMSAELRQKQFSREKVKVIKALDLLVIDEISMVRCDVLDAIDAVLRKVRFSDEPFGGVQLLMIGDLHQLPPVVRDQEMNEMREHWSTPYFFGSQALQRSTYRTIQLTHIFRQSDGDFIELLNRVRNDDLNEEVLSLLNQRFRPDFDPAEGSGYITLTSHNAAARRINGEKLGRLPGKAYQFRAEVEGKFPASMYPNEETLEFKVGAQVMFNKNDGPAQQYYNGKIGRITAIDGPLIKVSCGEGEPTIEVLPVEWDNRKYELDAGTREIKETVIGTYTQHPLRLAWAITIHKSQGLTFDRVVIDAADAFAHGQVYVALSRCKTFEGISLRTKIADRSVKTDAVVQSYSDRADKNKVSASDLAADRAEYELQCLTTIFSFEPLDRTARHLIRQFLEHERSLSGDHLPKLQDLSVRIREQLVGVGNKFIPRLGRYVSQGILPSNAPDLQQRLRDAATYFLPHLREIEGELTSVAVVSDNRAVAKTATEVLTALQLAVFVKISLFKLLDRGFTPTEYTRIGADAEMDFRNRRSPEKKVAVPAGLAHPELYRLLVNWRNGEAANSGKPAYVVTPTATLAGIAARLPTTQAGLLSVSGFGKRRFAEYGERILAIIQQYARSGGHPTDLQEEVIPATSTIADDLTGGKRNSDQISLALYQDGKTPAEIAQVRKITEGTVIGHLAGFITSGEVPANAIIGGNKLAALTPYFQDREVESLREVYHHFKEAYTYHELRVAEQESLRLRKLAAAEEEV
ncbi:hypothetical protein GGR28_000552 [Lewinella aquimaris]|uniref:HRDC domain-containing protein n=1 Tax=Neolewinella aquimaris TaxID=1835722 RepID=A0A840DY92_9BACT|nr:helix-turn-helix domain-containing protein [Neolewinella aquimaris]MBB4077951.1 hypothetical protein [Neolewinella aquimaris]